jgi:hypothetical protein
MMDVIFKTWPLMDGIEHKSPAHSPGLRSPSKHVVGVQSALPGKAVFVQDDPEASVAVQSPAFSAFGSSSDASQGPPVCEWCSQMAL